MSVFVSPASSSATRVAQDRSLASHASGNFTRDDISKTLNIPRKLRSRKKSAAGGTGSRRKSSTASSITFDYEYERRDQSPSPEPYPPSHPEDEDVPTQTHVSLSNYQLQPWGVVSEAHVASSPRSLPISPPTQVPYLMATTRDAPGPYDFLPTESPLARSYPSPIPAAASYSYESPTSTYRDSYVQHSQYPANASNYYYPTTSYAPPAHSASMPYGANELPPIRTITSGLAAGPASPSTAESYTPYPPPVPVPQPGPTSRRSSHVFVAAGGGEVKDGSASTLVSPVHQIPSGLVAMHQVDPYYPPNSPPRQQCTVVPPSHISPPTQQHHAHYFATSPASYSCAGQASADYHQQSLMARNGEVMYTTAAYH